MPPKITEAQTTQVAEIAEHTNVSIQCKASGHPKPSISWRREDGSPIRLNGQYQSPAGVGNASAQFELTSGAGSLHGAPTTMSTGE